MAWNYATRDVPYLRDYAAAVAHEASVKPIRGRKHECKPLGSRNKSHLVIRKGEEGTITVGYDTRGMVKIELDTALIIFRPNGEIVVRGDHRSTSLAVQARVLGTRIATRYGVNWIKAIAPGEDEGDVHDGWWPIRDDCRDRNPNWNKVNEGNPYGTADYEPYYIYNTSKMSVMRREADGHLRYVNVQYPAVHRVNRAALNAVRKEHGDFLRFARGVTKLYGLGEEIDMRVPADIFGVVEGHTISPMHGPRRHNIDFPKFTPDQVLAMLGDPERWRELVVWAHFSANARCAAWWQTNTWQSHLADAVLKSVMLEARRGTILTRDTVKTGKIVQDPNPPRLWR